MSHRDKDKESESDGFCADDVTLAPPVPVAVCYSERENTIKIINVTSEPNDTIFQVRTTDRPVGT